MKYIDADKLKYEIERRKLSNYYTDTDDYEAELFEIIDFLQQEQQEAILSKRNTEDIFAREYAIYSLPPFVVESIAYGTQLIDFIYKTAHHFYELGKNSK